MLHHPLLSTKITVPPVQAELVSRPRLFERLDAGLSEHRAASAETPGFARRLTLVSAPAGFGKTTLVSDWVGHLHVGGAEEDQLDYGIAWLSLDEGDNDPAGFLAYLIVALQTLPSSPIDGIGAQMGKRALSILRSPQPPPIEAVLTFLINEIAALPHRIILILDDYHLIEAPSIHQALIFLIEHLPPQMHLVISTRDDPQLPLSRLRARGQLTELRAADLRFSSSEVAEFLNQVMDLRLSAEDIAALETRTEGWIAGLQLAAISMQGREDTTGFIDSLTGSHRFVLDYLIEEVLERQSEEVQSFLLQTAILDRLTGPLVQAVLEDAARSPGTDPGGSSARASAAISLAPAGPAASQLNGQATLEALERANLFIVPLDDERQWYRYHQLFSDLLRHRLRQTRPGRVPILHRRASAWYERNGFADEAIHHALRTGDVGLVARLIEDHVEAVWQRGEHTKLRGWLAQLPVNLVLSKPHLCILRAWTLFTSGQPDEAAVSLEAAERALDAPAEPTASTAQRGRGQLSGSERMSIRGRSAAIRAFLAFYQGDARETRRYARQALDYLPEQDLTWRSTATVALGDACSFEGDLAEAYRVRSEALAVSRAAGNIYMVLIASMKLAVTLRQQGRLERAIEMCRRQLRLASRIGLSQTVVVGWLLAIWGEVLAERNDLDGAIELARQGTELTERGRDLAMLGWSYACLIRTLFSSGELTAAEETIQRMEDIARESYVPPWIMSQMEAWQARLWLVQGELVRARRWAAERGLNADEVPGYLHEGEHVVLARILIAQGRSDEAGRLLGRLHEAAEARGHTSREIQILALQALAFQEQGDTARGVTALERALALAEPEGFVRTFVDEGPPMARLLHEVAKRHIAPAHARRLLAAFPAAQPEQADGSRTHAPERKLIEPLSDRELEVLQLVAEGLRNRDIADRLFLSLNTVKAHTRNIYGKLNVHSRTQAVARSQTLGLLPREQP